MHTKLRVVIERDECINCATCWAICPDFFEGGPDDGLSQIVEKYRVDGNPGVGEAPEALDDCVRDASDGCPVGIIHIEKQPLSEKPH